MEKQVIYVPQGSLTVEEMEMVAGKLFKCGYTVKRGSEKINNKAIRTIEIWRNE